MKDVPEKTRFAVQMAVAARALVEAASEPHRKRVLGRYVFVYLHDVIRFAAPWRNILAADPRHQATAAAALPALDRLRGDWEHYQEVRHFIGAKRQPCDSSSPAVDQFETFKLWADIGELSIDALVDDAVEVYAQLAAADRSLPAIDLQPTVNQDLRDALAALDAIGEAGALELTASSFGAAKSGTFSARQGGDAGRLVPLLNDIAENILTLRALADKVANGSSIDQLIRCQLPTEIDEILRLSVGPAGLTPVAVPPLLAVFEEYGMPPEPAKQLRAFRDSIGAVTRSTLGDWRNRIGAHIDAEVPWQELAEAITQLDLRWICELAENVLLWLEVVAVQQGGPILLLLSSRRLTRSSDGLGPGAAGLTFGDPDADPGALHSTLPPAQFDSHHMIFVGGPKGSYRSAAVAGMIAGRTRELEEKLAAARERKRDSNG